MNPESKNQIYLTRAALITHDMQRGNFLSVPFLRVTHLLYILMFLLALVGRTAMAQFNPVEPALPCSVEYSLTASNYTWFQTSAPIAIGSYVQDLLSDSRLGQPVGRGAIGIVTDTGWDADYNTMAATVDFGRDFSAGIVFPELSSIELVPAPEPTPLLILLPGILLWRVALSRRAKATS